MTFKIQIELWVGLCINFTSELVIQALTQNPKSKIRFWILFFRNPKSDFGFQGDHAFQKVLLHPNTHGETFFILAKSLSRGWQNPYLVM